MPTFEYICNACECLFEEVLILRDEIAQFSDWYPCPYCKGRAEREKVSITNFNFKAPEGQTQGSGVHGQSGVHDLDYPKLDKAIGRSSDTKWAGYDVRKKDRDAYRRRVGTNSIIETPSGSRLPADESTMTLRERALIKVKEVKILSEAGRPGYEKIAGESPKPTGPKTKID